MLLALCDRPFVYSCQNVLYASIKPRWHGINPIFYAAVRRQTDKRKQALPLTGVVAVALATRLCSSVDVYGFSTMRHHAQTKRTCYYYWKCSFTDKWYHSRPGDAKFHDFQGSLRSLALLCLRDAFELLLLILFLPMFLARLALQVMRIH